MSDFLTDIVSLKNNLPPPGDIEWDRKKAIMVEVLWILPLTKGSAIVEGPIIEDIVIESFISYHPVAED